MYVAKSLATLAFFLLAGVAALVIWNYYVISPWTRDGRIRVQVASIAPQISGQVVELRVSDNQYVHKGDILYVINRFDYQVAYNQAKRQLDMKAADAEVKKQQSARRRMLSDLATTPEEQQEYAGSAAEALDAFESAQSQLSQADINLQRTKVLAPVNGFVTNLLMRVGDYARAGVPNISVVDADSFWIDGYFEETKLAHICIGDRAEAQLMGYARPIIGRVKTITRGIAVSDASPSTQGLPSVDPIYSWVRLAQRVPIRIAITEVPPNVPLVSGLTATVTIKDAEMREGNDWFERRRHELGESIANVFRGLETRPSCISSDGVADPVSTLDLPVPPVHRMPGEIIPGIAPSPDASPN